MTTREFDPVFSAALRNELEALADGAEQAVPAKRRPVLLRPQLWISLATALVLLVATLGVLHLTHQDAPPADSGPTLVDPLTRVTDPNSADYVARSVTVLIDTRGIGPGTSTFTSPADVDSMQVYLNCSGAAKYSVRVDRAGGGMGAPACERDSGSNFSTVLKPGTHTVTITVGRSVRWSLLIIEKPAPTVSTGALIDPLTQVRDRRDPDALTGDTRPLLRLHGSNDLVLMPARITVPQGAGRLRVFLACTPASAGTRLHIDGHVVSGCQNAIAHWFDFTPSAATITAQVATEGSGEWALLVVRAPKGAKNSPANTLLSYPAVHGSVLARARGVGAQQTGTYVPTTDTVMLTMTCRGTGWLEVQTGDGSTSTRGATCSTPAGVGLSGDGDDIGKRQHWTVTPHGDISWTVQVTAD